MTFWCLRISKKPLFFLFNQLLDSRAEMLQIFSLGFWKNKDTKKSSWNYLTFKRKTLTLVDHVCMEMKFEFLLFELKLWPQHKIFWQLLLYPIRDDMPDNKTYNKFITCFHESWIYETWLFSVKFVDFHLRIKIDNKIPK